MDVGIVRFGVFFFWSIKRKNWSAELLFKTRTDGKSRNTGYKLSFCLFVCFRW